MITETLTPMSHRSKPCRAPSVPIGSISLNIHCHADAVTLAQNGPVPLLAQGQVFHQGFSDQVG